MIYSRFQVNEVQILKTKPYTKRLSTLFPVPYSLFPAVWLSPDHKEAYLPPITNTDYYKNQVLDSINSDRNIAEKVYSQWDEEKKKQEHKKQYDERNKKWQQIKKDRAFSLWYDDNIGAFAITISVTNAKN
ncbi:hypothetical protein NIES4106_60440 (plasmid) [Fischerella sp. NIES-4106]|nr:hypothetical protein NIES4106_60440 [Fischerella sp. NIES-4106]